MTNKQNRCSVLQVAYYPSLLHTRQAMMEKDGHIVTSALGNEQCKAVAAANDFDVVVVGFSGKVAERQEIIQWLKQNRPEFPIVALRDRSEELPLADHAVSSQDPNAWLAVVREAYRKRT